MSAYTGIINQTPELVLLALENTYGTDVVPDVTHAVRAYDLQLDAFKSQMITRNEVRSFHGAQKRTPAQKHRGIKFKVEAAASGTAGGVPAWGSLHRACKLGETTISAMATIASAAPVPATTPISGAWTFTKTGAYVGLYARTVTITCTTAGDTGVAKCTVSAPAIPSCGLAAYSATGVTITNGTDLLLPGSAKVSPHITTPWAVGDSWTLSLLPPGTRYAPVSKAFESATLYFYTDGNELRRMTGVRGSVALVVEAGIPYWDYTLLGLWNEIETAIMPASVDFSAWQYAAICSPTTVPWFQVLGVEPAFKTCRIDLQAQTSFHGLVNYEYIGETEHDAKATITWNALPNSVLNLEHLISTGATGALDLQLGTTAGSALHVSAPAVSPTNYTIAYDQGVTQHNVDLTLYPISGGDDVVFTAL